MKNHFVVCACNSSEHTIRFMYDSEEKELYTEVYLNQHNNFFKRLKIAVKYLFGYTSKYGHFDCTMFSPDEVIKLRAFMNSVK